MIPELYLHGLSEGDFDLALRGLLGDDAPLSARTVSHVKERWSAELAEWRGRRLDELDVVHVWVDGVYVKAGIERDKPAVLVAIGALSDGSKVVIECGAGLQGVDPELVTVAKGSQRLWDGLSSTGGGRRTPRHLGSASQRLPRRGRAAVLEP